MKKNYINPQIEVQSMQSANLMQAGSLGFNVTGDIISGGNDGDNPGDGL